MRLTLVLESADGEIIERELIDVNNQFSGVKEIVESMVDTIEANIPQKNESESD